MIDAVLRLGTIKTRHDAAAQVVRDRAPSPSLSPGFPLLCPYVDNGNAICHSQEEAMLYHRHLCDILTEDGFALKDPIVGGDSFDMVGANLAQGAQILASVST